VFQIGILCPLDPYRRDSDSMSDSGRPPGHPSSRSSGVDGARVDFEVTFPLKLETKHDECAKRDRDGVGNAFRSFAKRGYLCSPSELP